MVSRSENVIKGFSIVLSAFDEVKVHRVLPEIFGDMNRVDRVVVFYSIILLFLGSVYAVFRDQVELLVFSGAIGMLGLWLFQNKIAAMQNINNISVEFEKWFLSDHRNYRYGKFKDILNSKGVCLADVENYINLIDIEASLLGRKYNYSLFFTSFCSFLLGVSVNLTTGMVKLNFNYFILILSLFFLVAIIYVVLRLFVPSWSGRYGELTMFLYRYKLDIEAEAAA